MIISKKHGVNPAIPLCFICNEPKNMVILAGRMAEDAEAPRNAVWDFEPCDKCKEHMAIGIILISCKDGESGNNPYRTGGWCVIKEEAVRKMFHDINDVFEKRMAFVPDQVWDAVGLPR